MTLGGIQATRAASCLVQILRVCITEPRARACALPVPLSDNLPAMMASKSAAVPAILLGSFT